MIGFQEWINRQTGKKGLWERVKASVRALGVINVSDLLTRIRAGEFDQLQEQKKEDAASILARIRAGEFDMPVAEPSPVTKQIPELKEDELARFREGGSILGRPPNQEQTILNSNG